MSSKDIQILFVEDSEDDAKLAMLALRRGGYLPSYRRVQDAAALRAALSQERWDAVLADFSLPHFSGLEALNIFRTTELDIPFIFVSGTIGEETAVAAMKAGASDYVMKQNLARLAPVLEREMEQALIRAKHRQAQIDLKLSRDRYMDLYDFAPVGYMTLSHDGEIVQLNLTCAAMLGGRREHLLHTRFAQSVAPAELDRWYEHFLQTLHRGSRHRLELLLHGVGELGFHAQLDCVRVKAKLNISMVRVVVTDISERKKAEADRQQFEAQLHHIQKMESIGTLAGGIAHDFNNILGAILGNVDLARAELGLPHAALSNLDEIHKASVRARNLVRQILTFSRREPQELQTQPLRPVVEETYKLLRATLPAGVEIHLALSDVPLHVQADATQIQQVLMNLCTNAWHALKDGAGRIDIGLEPVWLDGVAARRLGGLAQGAYVRLWVSDNGAGIPAEIRERIFEPFFTTKPVGRGTGLGLSVVHGILTAHHGAIEVESEPGRGSRFHMYVPCVEAQVDVASAQAVQAQPFQGHGEHVLYVDDDETMTLMVERILQRAGYRVSIFQDAQQAITAVREHPETFDFVVTDFNMPDCSGLDIAHAVARVRPDMPVVISTGLITEELRNDVRNTSVRGLLEKQNTSQDLGDMVGRILAGQSRPME
ncbi:hybrid sensor histidine kinase/response regulator [Roseateles cavernae]|uniref:hybrid sensor histidine kinase/response regulator n=1 Tax=Roseateles cavernae TaxID=3153578 RepID=UPI0032E43CF0